MKVLHVLSSLDGSGGVQRLLMNYYMYMNQEEIQFDFIVNEEERGELETFFEQKGCNIFHIVSKHKSLVKNLYQMNNIIRSGKYDVIHAHQDCMSIFPIFFAKEANIRKRIAHSHLAFSKKGIIRRCFEGICKYLLRRMATDWWACSIEAGKALWGKAAVDSGKVHIMKNAIDTGRFKYNKAIRETIRKGLEIQNHLVVGCVGRLTYQKNYERLISIFEEIYHKDNTAVLLIIGKGELEAEIKDQVEKIKLNSVVKFLGTRDDIDNLMQAMDIFILPSRYEGLGIVYIEAQASGLVCFGSDRVVPKEVKITNLMHFIPLEKSSKDWADEIMNVAKCSKNRESPIEVIKEQGYSVEQEVKKLEVQYGVQ